MDRRDERQLCQPGEYRPPGHGARPAEPAAFYRLSTAPPLGPLRVHPDNRRYFTDGRGKAIYLTGAHTWNNLQDLGTNDPPQAFDFPAYLDFLEQHHLNFIRLWRWELTEYVESLQPEAVLLHPATLAAERARAGAGRETQVRPDEI